MHELLDVVKNVRDLLSFEITLSLVVLEYPLGLREVIEAALKVVGLEADQSEGDVGFGGNDLVLHLLLKEVLDLVQVVKCLMIVVLVDT